jgi:hypothetical protein
MAKSRDTRKEKKKQRAQLQKNLDQKNSTKF